MGLRKKVLKNIFSNWANLVVNLVISFFLAPYVVHKLGNTYYGVWVIMMQFTGYLYLMDFGVRESIIKYVSRYSASGDKEKLDEILTSGNLIYCFIGLNCVLVSVVLAYFFPDIVNISDEITPTARIVVILAGLTVGQTLAFNVFGGILMGLQRFDIFNKVGIIFAFVRLASVLIFLNLDYGIIALALIQLFVGLGTNITIYISSRRLLNKQDIHFHYSKHSLRERIPTFKKLYHYSVYVLINNLGEKAIFYTDALIIGIFLPAASVTFYAIAGTLIEYLRRLILMTNNVLNPLTSELDSRQEMDKIHSVLIQGGRFSMLIALPICIIYLIMGRQFIGLWMGTEYTLLSGDVLFVLSISTLISIPHSTISNVLYGISRHKIIAYLRMIEAVCNLSLSLILVQTMGIVGVAIGTAIPHILLMSIILPILVARNIGLSGRLYIINVYAKPLAASIPFALFCYTVDLFIPKQSLLFFFLQVSLIIPTYFLGVWFICLDKEERFNYQSIARRFLQTAT